jgi:anti-anti-sigma regulatory factor
MSRELKLENDCFIGNITDTASLLLDAVRGGTDVVVDCADVERIDTAAIQMFLAVRKDAEALGVAFSLVQSDIVRNFATSIGVTL